jgi:hypothetical protein
LDIRWVLLAEQATGIQSLRLQPMLLAELTLSG